jgi:hypothetical protein
VRRVAIRSIALSVFIASSSAIAQQDPAERAQNLVHAGVAALNAGHWDEARRDFTEAYDLSHQPVILLNLAAAQAQTGQLVASAGSYRRFLAESDESLASYRDAAQHALDEVVRRTPRARIEVRGFAPGDRASLDGAAIDLGATGRGEREIDPGEHTFQVVRGSAVVARMGFSAHESETREASARIEPPHTEPVRVRAVQTPPRVHRASTVFASPWFWTLAGVLVVGGAVTITALTLSSGPGEPAFSGTIQMGPLVAR